MEAPELEPEGEPPADLSLDEKIQNLLFEHYRSEGSMVTSFYLVCEGFDSEGTGWWADAYDDDQDARKRLALIDWSHRWVSRCADEAMSAQLMAMYEEDE